MCVRGRMFTLLLVIHSFPLVLCRYSLGAITTVARWDQDLQQINQLLAKLQTVYILRGWLALLVVRPHPWLFWTMVRWALSALHHHHYPPSSPPLSWNSIFCMRSMYAIMEGKVLCFIVSWVVNWLMIKEYLESVCSSVWIFNSKINLQVKILICLNFIFLLDPR